MKGNERQVLRVVAELKETDGPTIARKVGVSAEYAAQICQGLINDGYLGGSGNGKYALTPKALKAMNPVRTRGHIAVLKGGG